MFRSISQWICLDFPFCRVQNLCQWQKWFFKKKEKKAPPNSSINVLGWFLREREAHNHGSDSPEQKNLVLPLWIIGEIGRNYPAFSMARFQKRLIQKLYRQGNSVHFTLRLKCNQNCPQGPAIKALSLLTFCYLVRELFTVRKYGSGWMYVWNLLGWG